MRKLKSQKGITLVALVITIIILIILAGISISIVLGEDGLIARSKGGAENYQKAATAEQKLLDDVNAFLDGQASTASSGTGGGSSTPTTPPAPTYTAYSIGQEVTVGGESFYVLEDSDASESTVTLLAKYNLNQAGTAQAPNAASTDTSASFSSTEYWQTAYEEYTDWSTKLLDLNTVSGETSGDAIYKAKEYAKTISGDNTNNSGRLLTYEEANTLKTSYSDMIWGRANRQGEDSSNYSLTYWLSSVSQGHSNTLYSVFGSRPVLAGVTYTRVAGFNAQTGAYIYAYVGVRPVITVSKSLVS